MQDCAKPNDDISESGRSERIRTSDPLYPKQVRYQAAPRSDVASLATVDLNENP